ncbi:hypothetical protein OG349_15205 [Streptomyces sp. NBC_01317]|uniref:hypothetical protein n=1 Tax=Streptomyces sp. NBC_01317 TaxID=2903822 RepID=UPI002E13052F|nr:hypothetical protein OG349_15205 [Streptomyces sp. NBC_01317]
MSVMRRSLLVVVSAVTAVVMGAGSGTAVAPAPTPASAPAPGTAEAAGAPAPIAPEADLAHHGQVSLWDGQLHVWIGSDNHGPSGLPGATVRLEFSVPLAPGQSLPPACLWGGDRTVLCRTGELRAGGRAHGTALDLLAPGSPAEVVVDVDTAWNGGASDRNPENNHHRVLAPATGDPYIF